MRRCRWRTWLVSTLAAGILTGCGSTRLPYPQDPLLIGRRPVVGKVEGRRSVQIASEEPVPTPLPPEALARCPQPPGTPAEPDQVAPGRAGAPTTMTSGPKAPLQALPALRRQPDSN
jgi:hypothetical protein